MVGIILKLSVNSFLGLSTHKHLKCYPTFISKSTVHLPRYELRLQPTQQDSMKASLQRTKPAKEKQAPMQHLNLLNPKT